MYSFVRIVLFFLSSSHVISFAVFSTYSLTSHVLHYTYIWVDAWVSWLVQCFVAVVFVQHAHVQYSSSLFLFLSIHLFILFCLVAVFLFLVFFCIRICLVFRFLGKYYEEISNNNSNTTRTQPNEINLFYTNFEEEEEE